MRTAAPVGSRLPWLAIAVFALAAVLIGALLWWRPWHRETTSAGSAATQSSPTAASGTNDGVQAGPAAADEGADGAAPASPAGAAGGAGVPDAAGVPGVSGAPGAALGSAVVGPQPKGDAATGAGRARLRLRFSADSWVDVRDAAGQRVFAGNGRANTVRTIVGAAPLRVYLRAASGVQLEINNHAVAIGPQYVVGNVARFEAGADGVLRRDTHTAAPRPRG
jgi:cytoskeleton protein RodZ